MKRLILILLALLLSRSAFAQSTCNGRMVGPFTPAQARELCQEFGSAVGQSLIPSADDTYDLGTSALNWRDLWLGRDLRLTASTSLIAADTSDGADNKELQFCGGGAFGFARGACLRAQGNEAGGTGSIVLVTGDASAADFQLSNRGANGSVRVLVGGGTERWVFGNTGNLTSNSTNGGDLIFSGSGDTISVQEGTPASACMGTATPNGTTNVAVSTTCAVSGSRVFFTRVGAITNMGTISTTVAPSGTGFSFASTGASDTLAGSVVWMIVKESA